MAAIEVDVLMFGPLADLAAASKVRVALPEGTKVAGLIGHLREFFPALAPHLGSVAVAINLAYAARGTPLSSGDEVALIPPVSGG